MAHVRKYTVLKPFEVIGQKYAVGATFPGDADAGSPTMERETSIRLERGFIGSAEDARAVPEAPKRGKAPAEK